MTDPAASPLRLAIESLDLEANGVARHDGKVVFVRGALPGETVQAAIVRRKPRFDVAETLSVERQSAARVHPRCAHFGVCGGCSMQHLEPSAQLAIKQRSLEDQLWHLGKVTADSLLRPIAGPTWGYRYRARLSVRDVAKKGGVLVGFHERGSSFVADMRECHVLPPHVAGLLLPLRELIGALSIARRLPQIELAVGDQVTALVLRVLEPPSEADEKLLAAFAADRAVELWLQHKGPDAIELFCTAQGVRAPGITSALSYCLPEFDVTMPFRPTDFTQVNHSINEVLVGRAVRLLAPQAGEQIADLFCGLGNFSLPIARSGAMVIGVEGSATLVRRATENAARNGLAGNTRFQQANLFAIDAPRWAALGALERLLIDPPREGALEVCKQIVEAAQRPHRIVYVSCNPATLARDAGLLVHHGGYRVSHAGAVNMFPHTSHVESMAVFDLQAAAPG